MKHYGWELREAIKHVLLVQQRKDKIVFDFLGFSWKIAKAYKRLVEKWTLTLKKYSDLPHICSVDRNKIFSASFYTRGVEAKNVFQNLTREVEAKMFFKI